MNIPFDDPNNLQGWLNRFGFSEGFKSQITALAENEVHHLQQLYNDLPSIANITHALGTWPQDYQAFEEARLHTSMLNPQVPLLVGDNLNIDNNQDGDVLDLEVAEGVDNEMVIVGEGARQGEPHNQAPMVEHLLSRYETEPIGQMSDLWTFGMANRSVVHFADEQHLWPQLTYHIASQEHATQGSVKYYHAVQVLPVGHLPRRCLRMCHTEGWALLSSIYSIACHFAAHRALCHFIELFNGQFPQHAIHMLSACVCRTTNAAAAFASNPYFLCEELPPVETEGAEEDLIAAFSHWTFFVSNSQLLLLPSTAVDGGVVYLTADPVVHCANELCYGRRNRAEAAFRSFFENAHAQCNNCCRQLGLDRPVFLP
eukprot:gene29873-36068_t